jgi:hypothetical protein
MSRSCYLMFLMDISHRDIPVASQLLLYSCMCSNNRYPWCFLDHYSLEGAITNLYPTRVLVQAGVSADEFSLAGLQDSYQRPNEQ